MDFTETHNALFNFAEVAILPGLAFGHAQEGGAPSIADSDLKKYSSMFSLTSEFRERHQIDDYELQEAQNCLHLAHQSWIAVMRPDDIILLTNSNVNEVFEQLVVGFGMIYSEEQFGLSMRKRAEKDGGKLTMLTFMDWYVRHLYFAEDDEDEEY